MYYPCPKSGVKWVYLIWLQTIYIDSCIIDSPSLTMDTKMKEKKTHTHNVNEMKWRDKFKIKCTHREQMKDKLPLWHTFSNKWSLFLLPLQVIRRYCLFQYNSVWGYSRSLSLTVSPLFHRPPSISVCSRSHRLYLVRLIWCSKWNTNFAEFGIYQVIKSTADMSFHIPQTLIEPRTQRTRSQCPRGHPSFFHFFFFFFILSNHFELNCTHEHVVHSAK